MTPKNREQANRTNGKGQSSKHVTNLDALWDELLSRQPERVRAAYISLSIPEQEGVYAHLQRMANEPGWQHEQRLSARAALQALEDQSQ